MRKFLRMMGVVFLWAGTTGLGVAQITNSWTNSTSGFWSTAAAWTVGVPATTQSVITINNTLSKTVTVNGVTAAISNLLISAGGATNTLTISNNLATPFQVLNACTINSGGQLLISAGSMIVTGAATPFWVTGPSLTVSNGGFLTTSNASIGEISLRETKVNLLNGTLTNFGTLNCAVFADGTATVRVIGGALHNPSATLRLGGTGVATVLVSNGFTSAHTLQLNKGTATFVAGTNTVVNDLYAGFDANRTGTVWMTGGRLVVGQASSVGNFGVGQLAVSNGTWQADTVYVGANAGSQGTLTVAGGANQISTFFSVGNNAGATGTVWMTGGLLTVTNEDTDATIGIGFFGTGRMTVSNGTWLARDVSVGTQAGAQGTLTIAGGTNQVTSSGFTAGLSGTGTVWLTGGLLIMTNNLAVLGFNNSGRMTVSNGTWSATNVVVGYNTGARGTLTIAGGSATLNSFLTLGNLAGSTGVLWMTGGQLAVTKDETDVGLFGVGQMTVSNGTWLAQSLFIGTGLGSQGTLTIAGGTNHVTGLFSVGDGTGSTGTVRMTGGKLTVTNDISYIGGFGVGQMDVAGGVWQTADLIMGDSSLVSGALWLTGGQINSTIGETDIGLGGRAQMTVSNGTWQSRDVYVGINSGSQGTLTIAGGTNTISSFLYAGNDAGSTGVIWMTGGQLTSTTDETVLGYSGNGRMIVSNGTWQARLLRVAFAPGSQGTLTIAGGTNSCHGFGIGVDASSTGTVWLTGGQLTANILVPNTVIGNIGNGRLTVSNGTLQAVNGFVGLSTGSQGTLTIAGGSSTFSTLTVGRFACDSTAIVNVNGGTLAVTNAAGNATLEIQGGTFTLSGGTLRVDRLVVTNSCARFIHTGGTLITNVVVLPPFFLADADGDGIGNSWEVAAGLNPFNPADGNVDSDGDGLTNLQEFETDTDPRNATDFLHITSVVATGNHIRVTWPVGHFTGIPLRYEVYAATNLTTGFTTNLTSGFIFSGTATVTNYLDVGGATNKPARFYRIRGLID